MVLRAPANGLRTSRVAPTGKSGTLSFRRSEAFLGAGGFADADVVLSP
jgi:hypothetical protein